MTTVLLTVPQIVAQNVRLSNPGSPQNVDQFVCLSKLLTTRSRCMSELHSSTWWE
jgi:hypothetical protein